MEGKCERVKGRNWREAKTLEFRRLQRYGQHYCFISDWVIPKSVSSQDTRESSDCCLSESFTSPSCTLGVDLRRGRRRLSGNLQLPPLSWRQGERSRTPDNEIIARPTSLPFGAPPRIDITPVDPEWWVGIRACITVVTSNICIC